MRTTLTLDDALLRELKRRAADQGIPLKEMIDRTLKAGLQSLERRPPRRAAKVPVFRMGDPTTVDLDKALSLAGELDNEEHLRKMALRK